VASWSCSLGRWEVGRRLGAMRNDVVYVIVASRYLRFPDAP